MINLMAEKGIAARIMQRRSSYMVYLKSGNAILEFLAFAGAHRAALLMEEERVVESISNRCESCDQRRACNEQKSSNAAVEQLYAIRVVLKHYGMENLPPALQEFIKLRVTYPDATLKELGAHSTPPLSKSAIYHRVRRLESMAREMSESER